MNDYRLSNICPNSGEHCTCDNDRFTACLEQWWQGIRTVDTQWIGDVEIRETADGAFHIIDHTPLWKVFSARLFFVDPSVA